MEKESKDIVLYGEDTVDTEDYVSEEEFASEMSDVEV